MATPQEPPQHELIILVTQPPRTKTVTAIPRELQPQDKPIIGGTQPPRTKATTPTTPFGLGKNRNHKIDLKHKTWKRIKHLINQYYYGTIF